VDAADRWTVLARVDRSRGRRGEVLATSFTDGLHRIARTVYLIGPDAQSGPHRVEEVWEHQGRLVLKLSGVDSIDDAERFRGYEICVPREAREPAPEGSYHIADLIGCRVEDKETGELVGSVEGWQESGGPVLLEVRTVSGEEILIPFAASICVDIFPDARKIAVRLPEGLADLNRP
jgi:16S rRNA processing protein RimM